MFKKLIALIMATLCLFSFSVSVFASETDINSVTKEVLENGTFVGYETLETESGTYRKDIYSYVEEVSTTRSAEQCFEQTVMYTFTPLENDSRATTDPSTFQDVVYLKLTYVTSPSADDYSDQTGYRLTRVHANKTSSVINFDSIKATCASLKCGAPHQYMDLSGTTSNNATMYTSFSEYISNVKYSVLGANLYFTWNGTSNAINNYLFNNM